MGRLLAALYKTRAFSAPKKLGLWVFVGVDIAHVPGVVVERVSHKS
jgi:hypothetical protein